ncbi:4-hydroxythreonine-4-phosphate dehydrogenase [Algimonas ampicilliniresistens]|uniref:4-hydroxythreonine-4-phosphate dehydrogenase n=1 Tax=Algimonas ampicilliniresistens TaxID=1298735 RepID=A0ABQ5VCV2_9PROT|nr:4-hydroxythreonine-4-phosphate dehydrogenase PdxA [Algimonas ampicilliniresistens]GLQ24912.1 4-hydroxythreonine-4-phosphate dehydrogenase [Algimonas ampicilliniresistens]
MRPLALTLGDPAGIGPEVTWKAWERLRGNPELAFAVIAPPSALKRVSRSEHPLALLEDISEASDQFSHALPVLPIEGNAAIPGQADPVHADTITRSIQTAVTQALLGQADAVVTNPIAKDVLYRAGFSFPGHTEYLGALCKGVAAPYHPGPVMMLTAPDSENRDLRVGLATIHIPLQTTSGSLTPDVVMSAARTLLGALKLDFGIENPRLAVCGLNPHAGENGALGTEEQDVINPVCRLLRSEGHDISDALPADTLFHAEARLTYDGVLAMYHDQGLIPVKTLDFHRGVNVTLGLPIVRTSPDHGTAFNIAGQGIARPDSLIAALRKAREIATHRHGH